MKVSLISIGKTKQAHILDGLKFYQKRLGHYVNYNMLELPDEKHTGKLSKNEQKRKEASRLLKHCPDASFVVALDEHGKDLSSVAFANWIQKRMNSGTRDLIFLIGGAYGHGEQVLKRANFNFSMSSLTFPHDLIRLLFSEQLYRAMTILKNEPYHHK